jgi:chemotaxis protein MotB
MKLLYTFAAITLLCTSCVSTKKYEALNASKDLLQKDYNQLLVVRKEKEALQDSLLKLNANLIETSHVVDQWKARYGSLYATNEEAQQQLQITRSQHQETVHSASAESERLRAEIAAKMKEVDEREKELRLMEANVKSNKGTLDEMKNYLSDREKKIKELNDALVEKDFQTAQLRQKISDILRGYAPGDLTVKQENGKIYVSMSQNLLFSKGSDVIDPKGAEAIKKLATALAARPDIDINVEGHTDADGTPEKNWALSTSRAQSVARVLLANKVDPKRLITSGRAFYHPIAPNDTEANKAKNRRTEIILSPQLEGLYDLIKK